MSQEGRRIGSEALPMPGSCASSALDAAPFPPPTASSRTGSSRRVRTRHSRTASDATEARSSMPSPTLSQTRGSPSPLAIDRRPRTFSDSGEGLPSVAEEGGDGHSGFATSPNSVFASPTQSQTKQRLVHTDVEGGEEVKNPQAVSRVRSVGRTASASTADDAKGASRHELDSSSTSRSASVSAAKSRAGSSASAFGSSPRTRIPTTPSSGAGVISVPRSRLRPLADPMLLLLGQLQKIMYLTQLPPDVRHNPARHVVESFKRHLFAAGSSGNEIKARLRKLSTGSQEVVDMDFGSSARLLRQSGIIGGDDRDDQADYRPLTTERHVVTPAVRRWLGTHGESDAMPSTLTYRQLQLIIDNELRRVGYYALSGDSIASVAAVTSQQPSELRDSRTGSAIARPPLSRTASSTSNMSAPNGGDC